MANPYAKYVTGAQSGGIYTLPPTPEEQARTVGTETNTAGKATDNRVNAATAADQIRQQQIKTQMDALKLAQAQQAASTDDNTKKVAAADEAARNLINATQRADSLTTGMSTGGAGWAMSHAPWVTDASRLHSTIDQQLRGNIFRNWVDSLKAQSDNGSTGIGRVLQSEIPLVTGAQGALDQFNMDANDMKDSYRSIQNGAVRSSALTHGEDPNKPGVVDKYRQRFGLPTQLEVAASNPNLKPEAAQQALFQAFNAYYQNTIGMPKAQRDAGFNNLVRTPGIQALIRAKHGGEQSSGDGWSNFTVHN